MDSNTRRFQFHLKRELSHRKTTKYEPMNQQIMVMHFITSVLVLQDLFYFDFFLVFKMNGNL